jgi:DnaK suppressor protein
MTKPLTSKSRREFIARTNEHLKSMRVGLIHELAAEFRPVNSGTSGGSLDTAELASIELEQNMTVILSRRDRDRIIEIDHALKRMAEANYGVCEACGFEITTERLKVMPFTRHCRDCKQDQEREAKTHYRGDDNEQDRSKEFGSSPAEDEINQQSK